MANSDKRFILRYEDHHNPPMFQMYMNAGDAAKRISQITGLEEDEILLMFEDDGEAGDGNDTWTIMTREDIQAEINVLQDLLKFL